MKDLYIDGDNKAKYGIKCSYLTNTSLLEGLRLQYCTEAGLYLTRCWYAEIRNIYSLNNKYGFYLYGLYQANEDSKQITDSINGIQFKSCFLNHSTEAALYIYIYRGGSALSFSGCTFENSGGSQEIKIESLYNDVSFYSCYWETTKKIIDCSPSYSGAGDINIIGGLIAYKNIETQLITFSDELESLSLIGNAWRNNSGESDSSLDYIFDVASTTVFALGRLPYFTNTFNEDANVFALGDVNNWSQVWRGLPTKSLGANVLRAISNESTSEDCSATFELGAAQLSNVNSSYGVYRLRLRLDKTSQSVICELIRNNNGEQSASTVFTIGEYSDITFAMRIYGWLVSKHGSTDSRPSSSVASHGTMYLDDTLQMPIWRTVDGYWRTADGHRAALKKGITAERPISGDVETGFTYYDTDLNKMILWGNTGWVNLDGTAL